MSGPIRTSTTLRFALLLTLANEFLDAHTYLARGGVFANVQTGNVVFFAIDAAERKWAAAFAHVWERILPHPLRWTMGIQAVALAIIGLFPHRSRTAMSRCRSHFLRACRSACSATSATLPIYRSRPPAT